MTSNSRSRAAGLAILYALEAGGHHPRRPAWVGINPADWARFVVGCPCGRESETTIWQLLGPAGHRCPCGRRLRLVVEVRP